MGTFDVCSEIRADSFVEAVHSRRSLSNRSQTLPPLFDFPSLFLSFFFVSNWTQP